MVMVKFFKSVVLFVTLCIIQHTNSQTQDASPCPRLFVYEGKSKEPDKWYGIITLLNEADLKGIWLRVMFDRPTLQLGNWFGQVTTTDNKEYLIKNRNFVLKAHTPHSIRFYVKYDTSQPPPRLISFRQNAKTVCPEGTATESPSPAPELQTSGDNPQQPPSSPPPPVQSGVIRPEGFNLGPPGTGDDDVYPSDFHPPFSRPSSSHPSPADSSDLNTVCGTVIAQPRPLIPYGQPTRVGEFPWHAALYHAKGIDLSYICGASLISKLHVVSVAHCVTRGRSQTPLNPDNLVVYLGKFYLKRFSSPGIQDREVAVITPHPRYNPQSFSNDIAIIKLTQAAEITDYVRPVCIWQESTDLNTILNKQGNVVGWGFDETGKVTEQLMQAKMPIVSLEKCILSFPDFYSRFTSANTYCAGFRNGTSVCNGDSGGGMVFPKSNPNSRTPVWQLRGIVSISVALENQLKCDTSHYVVFTDAAKHLDWIKQVMMK